MATDRYQGRYSPGAAPGTPAGPVPADAGRFAGRPARQVSGRARLLYLAALPMLIAGIGEILGGDPTGMAVELGSFALLVSGAVLVNEGLKAEDAFRARKVARPPAFPRKIVAAVLTGAGVGLGAALGWGLGAPGIGFGIGATLAHLAAFGLDPLRAKGMTGIDAAETERVALAIERAEAMLSETLEAARRFADRALEGRVERFASAAREVFRTVEADPRDLSRARRFLGIYLTGARDATVKFADIYARGRDPQARRDYEALLGDLETSFARHRETLMIEDRGALDVEIEVLRQRLKQDGLA